MQGATGFALELGTGATVADDLESSFCTVGEWMDGQQGDGSPALIRRVKFC